MKHFTLTLILFFFCFQGFSQAPAAFNYQAVLRDALGNIRTNTAVTLRIDLLQGSATGAAVYSESFSATTNSFGLINLQIGKGTVLSGTFSSVDWGAGPYYIKINVDGTEMSTSQVLSVPYALYAAKSGNGFSGSYNDLTNKPVLFSGSYADLTNRPAIFSGRFTDLADKPVLANVANTGKYEDLLNKPNLSDTVKYLKKEADPLFEVSVAKGIKASDTTRWSGKSTFSGNYKDLTNKPVLITPATVMVGSVAPNNTTGDWNTAVGVNALADNTTGIENVAIGYWTLNNNTTGKQNCGVGTRALRYSTEGSANTAVGFNSMLYNQTGSNNTATGSSTLYTNRTGHSNSAFGYSALYSNTSGNRNIAVGANALQNNLNGSDNTAIGVTTMNYNYNGSQNVAVGNYALYKNYSGNRNVAVGTSAMYNNTTGKNNVAVGDWALNTNNTGYGNTAVGATSLYTNEIGRWNTAIGDSALMKANTDKNTAIGFQSLVSSTGWDNTAVGYQSLIKNEGGFDNVAIGVEALNSNTSGNGNTAIGKLSMITVSTGSNNTAIGFKADISNASNSTAIGHQANVNASNKVVIGNSSVTSIGGYASWTNYSDIRLKENINYNNQLGLNFITELKTATYNYRDDTGKRLRNGLIAQDVQKVLVNLDMNFSGLIVDDNPEKTLNLSYAEFVMPLINSVQELNLKNKELQQKNDLLEATLNKMKTDIETLKKALQNK